MNFIVNIQQTLWVFKLFVISQVVYALNTKNDEHDAHISCLQEAHELELKKVTYDLFFVNHLLQSQIRTLLFSYSF